MAKGTAVVSSAKQTVDTRISEAMTAMARTTDDVANNIMAQILSAETVDDVFAATTVVHAEDRYGEPLRITAVTLNESSFNEGPSAYVVITAHNYARDEDETITCGGGNIVAMLIKLFELNALPIDVVIYQSERQTANGYNVTLMRRALPQEVSQASSF